MEFKKDILALLGQCIENSAIKIEPNGNKVRKIAFRESADNNVSDFNQVVKVIDSGNLAIETLYSYEKFIEILDNHGFEGFVS